MNVQKSLAFPQAMSDTNSMNDTAAPQNPAQLTYADCSKATDLLFKAANATGQAGQGIYKDETYIVPQDRAEAMVKIQEAIEAAQAALALLDPKN